MLALGFLQRACSTAAAVFVAAALFSAVVPAGADTVPANAAHPQAKRNPASFTTQPGAGLTPQKTFGSGSSGLLFFPGASTGVNVGGRVSVGKTHVYVPYYGTVSNDPAHPGVQGTAGLAYGFRTWDISVFNNAQPAQAAVPGADQPKVNPSLQFSIRF